MSDQPPKEFPFLYGTRERRLHPDWPNGFPWHLLAPHEAQAQTNHGQSLETLAARGGLDPKELYAVLTDKRYQDLDPSISAQGYIAFLYRHATMNPPDASRDRASIEAVAQAAVDFWRHDKQSARDRMCAITQLAALRKLGWKAPYDLETKP